MSTLVCIWLLTPGGLSVINMNTMRNNLKIIRTVLGLSQTELAAGAGLSRQAIVNLESDRNMPSLQTAISILRIIRTKYEELTTVKGRRVPLNGDALEDRYVRRFLARPWGLELLDDRDDDPDGNGTKRKGPTDGESDHLDNERCESAPPSGGVAARKATPKAPEGFLRSRAENPTQPVIHSEADAISAVKDWHRRGCRHAEGRALAQAVKASLPSYASASDPLRRLRRRAGLEGRLRKRSQNASVQERNAAVLAIIEPAYSWLRKNNTQSKGANDRHTFGWMNSTVTAILSNAEIQQRLQQDVGYVPEVGSVIRLLRDQGHRVDPREECHDYVQRMAGWRPRYAGQIIMADATGLAIHASRSVAALSGKDRKYAKLWMHVGIDPASAYTWLGYDYADTETAGWGPFLQRLLLQDLQYAPEVLMVDKVSGIFASLGTLRPESGLDGVPPEVLLWLAVGVTPHITTPERPTAKAAIESTNRIIKHGPLNSICVRRLMAKQLAGEGLGKARHFESAEDLARVMDDLRPAINSRVINRAGDTRENVWAGSQDATARSARALVAGSAGLWLEIVSRAKLTVISGSRIKARVSGQSYGADLEQELPFKASEALAVVVPCGLREGDDPEQYRVIAMEETAGEPRFHQLTARAAARDRFGFDASLPIYGEGYRALPDTLEQRVQRQRDAAASQHVAAITQRKDQRRAIEAEFEREPETTQEIIEAAKKVAG